MTGLALAAVGAYGVFLVYSALVLRWTGLRVVPGRGPRRSPADAMERWMREAGIPDVGPAELAAVTAVLALVGATAGFAIFGGPVPALVAAAFAATAPLASYRARRAARLAEVQDAWPHLIEEIRVLTSAAGRSLPQALLDVGRRGPEGMRPTFEAASREWLLTTDFERTVEVIRNGLADPIADATCETLLVAHEVGSTDLDRRLAEIAEDRRIDNIARKDARAKQAGVRFSRRFVIAVPLGMALAGMSLGDGRDAYRTPTGQALVAVGLLLVAACWAWSGSMLKLPRQERVFG